MFLLTKSPSFSLARIASLAGILLSSSLPAFGQGTVTTPDADAVTVVQTFVVQPFGVGGNYRLTVLVPASRDQRQTVLEQAFSRPPTRQFTVGGNHYAEFSDGIRTSSVSISITTSLSLFRDDLEVAKARTPPEADSSPKKDAPATRPEKYLESDASQIKTVASRLKQPTQLATAEAVHQFVLGHLTYASYDSGDHGALYALEHGRGDCTEFSDLFVALCRSAGLQARSLEGYTLSGAEQRHDWAEVYFDHLGWVPFDPTLSASESETSFDRLRNNYVCFSDRRNDSDLDNHHYWSYSFWGSHIQVTADVQIVRGQESGRPPE